MKPPRFQMRVFPWCTRVLSPQLFTQHIVHFNCALRGCDHVQIIEEGRESLTPLQPIRGCQGRMLSKTEQHGHERIALFPTLSLENVVDASETILPQESGRPPVEHSDEG